MKKTFLLFMLAVTMMAGKAFAQLTSVAVLQHEDNSTIYYGRQSLSQAYNDALEGDVIVLSSGIYKACNLNKHNIIIRGTGMYETTIDGNFQINGQNNTIEDLLHNGTIQYVGTVNSFNIVRCRLHTIEGTGSDAHLVNAKIIFSKVANALLLGEDSSIQCMNSVIVFPFNDTSDTSSFLMTNCVIILRTTDAAGLGYTPAGVGSSLLTNCFIFVRNQKSYYYFKTGGSFPASTKLTYCYSNDADVFANNSWEGNGVLSTTEVFEDFDGTYNDNMTFRLTADAAVSYLGTDNTQIGIYGGLTPFDTTPSSPRITKFEVAPKAVDGEVKVNVEVNGGE